MDSKCIAIIVLAVIGSVLALGILLTMVIMISPSPRVGGDEELL